MADIELFTQLRQLLTTHFSVGEIHTFCFDLGVDYEDLPGASKTDKARELIAYMQRHSRLDELILAGRQSRSDVSWPELNATPGTRPSPGGCKDYTEPTVPIPPPTEGISPFIAGPPIIYPCRFFGRGEELQGIFDLLKEPLQEAVIIGPRRSGKTSLLQYIKNITVTPATELRPGQRHDWLPQPTRYRWVFVDFQDPRVGSREGLLRHLLTSLGLGIPRPCNLERFMDILSENLSRPTVILLDEIGVALERYRELDDTLWDGLRSLACSASGGNLAFILTCHTSPGALAHDSGHSSPFFNIFGYSAELGPLTYDEARDLISSTMLD